jgi:hypothetical protein
MVLQHLLVFDSEEMAFGLTPFWELEALGSREEDVG